MDKQENEQLLVGYIRYEKAAPHGGDIYARIKEFVKAKEGIVSRPGEIGVLDGHTNWEAIMYVVPLYKGERTMRDFIDGLRAHVPELTEVDGEIMSVPPGRIAKLKADSAKPGRNAPSKPSAPGPA